MGKINPVSAKYVVTASIVVDGIAEKPDVIGAVFGQTEGLLGSELELRELQKSGRIGRIEVNTQTKGGKTQGEIVIPSSLDKAETAIVASALEIIQRIGPCNATVKTMKIEDIRISKRQHVIDRAKLLLKTLMDDVMPDSQELADEVTYSVRVLQIEEYGKDRLPSGPSIKDSEEIILVEGRADVVNLLKHGFNNAIAMNGTSVPETIVELCKKKVVTAFLDGDRGGDIILKELALTTNVDFVCRAPNGMEVEEITKKEIHQALRSKIAFEQALHDSGRRNGDSIRHGSSRDERSERSSNYRSGHGRSTRPYTRSGPRRSSSGDFSDDRPSRDRGGYDRRESSPRKASLSDSQKADLKKLAEDMIGSRGAALIDKDLKLLGRVPVSEMVSTINNLAEAKIVIFDGSVESSILSEIESSNVEHVIGMSVKGKPSGKINFMTIDNL